MLPPFDISLPGFRECPALTCPCFSPKLRSALNRATRKNKRSVATATDENYLYVWNSHTAQAAETRAAKFLNQGGRVLR